jgi:hypothetical protein
VTWTMPLHAVMWDCNVTVRGTVETYGSSQLNRANHEGRHCHRFRRNRASRPARSSATARALVFVRIASRHPDRGRMQFGIDDPQLQTIEATRTLATL